MVRELPSFPALRAFDAAARHLSFKLAADELCLTQSAVSHQVKALEDFIGAPLFLRGHQKVRLTKRGTEYHKQISQLIDGIEAATLSIKDRPVRGRLNVQASASFSALWLLPRLKNFRETWPEIELNISTNATADSINDQPFDIRINCGLAFPPGPEEEAFMSSPRVPVCSPSLLKSGPEIAEFGDVAAYPLLRELDYDSWEEWFSNCGFKDIPTTENIFLENAQMTLKAAEDGQGITLGHTALIEDKIASGELVQLFESETAPYVIYTVTCPIDGMRHPRVAAFREWLVQQAGDFSEMGKPKVLRAIKTN